MDLVLILAAAFAGGLAGSLCLQFLNQPKSLESVSWTSSSTPVYSLFPEEGHVHEATTANPGGWFCECGAHRHVYVFPVEDSEDKRCQCGAIGQGKEWA